MNKLFLLIYLFVSGITSVYAAAGDSLQFTHFNIENGLPSNYVYSTVQDRQGYTWILTDNGIVKYNGYTFKLFNTSNGLPSNDVWYLKEDNFGRMWLFTYAEEIGYIKNDVYKKVDLPVSNMIKIATLYSKNDLVFIKTAGSLKGHYFVIDSNDYYKHIDSFTNYEIYAFQKDLVYMYPSNYTCPIGILKFTPTSVQKVHECDLTKEMERIPVTEFSALQSEYHGLYFHRGSSWLFFINLLNCSTMLKNLKDYGAAQDEHTFLIYSDSTRYFVITNRSFYLLDKSASLIKKIAYKQHFTSSQLTFYREDAQGNAWLSTKSDGCFLYQPLPDAFHRDINLSKDLQKARMVNSPGSIYSYWFDDDLGQLMTLSGNNRIIKRAKTSGSIRKISFDTEGNEYFDFKEGMKRFDTATGNFESLIDPEKPVYTKNYIDGDYTILLKKRKDSIQEFTDYYKQIAYTHLSETVPYNRHQLYGISHLGLVSIEIKEDHVLMEPLNRIKYAGLHYDNLRNRYWAYSNTNITVLNPANQTFFEIKKNTLALLHIHNVKKLYTDAYHNIYVQDENKIAVWNTLTWKYQVLHINVNLFNTALYIHDNDIICYGKFGVAMAHIRGPSSVSDFTVVPNVSGHYNQVFDVSVNDDNILLHTDKGIFLVNKEFFTDARISGFNKNSSLQLTINAPVQASIHSMDTLILKPGVEKITLDNVRYYGKGPQKFSCRVSDGSMAPYTTSVSEDIYTGKLKPGKVYKVECTVSDNIWKSDLHTFYIYKQPLWYQSQEWLVIFWISGILLLLSFIFSTIIITRKVLVRSNEKKQALIELELRALYSQINPHFIFNTLSAALYSINKRDYQEAYTNVSKFSSLLRAYLKSSRNRYSILSEEIEMLKNYIELQKTRFDQKFDYNISIDNKIPIHNVQIPSLLLQPLVENAINHGLFHREKDGFLQIRFLQGRGSDELLCFIEDNGIGRERAKEINAGSASKRQSFGTELTKELITLFEKYEQMNIHLEYIDKQMPETGTIVKLTIRNLQYIA